MPKTGETPKMRKTRAIQKDTSNWQDVGRGEKSSQSFANERRSLLGDGQGFGDVVNRSDTTNQH